MDRDAIIQTAVNIAQRDGWAKASVRNISKEINYSTIKIYSEFGSKDNLLYEVQKQGFRMLHKAMIDAIETEVTPENQFIALNIAHYEFALDNKVYYDLMFQMNGTNCKHPNDNTKMNTSQPIRSLLAQLSSEPPSKSLFFNWWALIHGFVAVSNDKMSRTESIEILKEIVQRFIKSIR